MLLLLFACKDDVEDCVDYDASDLTITCSEVGEFCCPVEEAWPCWLEGPSGSLYNCLGEDCGPALRHYWCQEETCDLEKAERQLYCGE